MPTMQPRSLRFLLAVLLAIISVMTVLSLSQLSRAKARNAATISVDTTADDDTVNGNCTLREAILAANTDTAVDTCAAGSGTDTIAFAIAGAGPHTIMPTSQLPTITAPVVIDGTTQAGASCTTTGGLKIELNGAGLHIIGGNSTVKGLVINRSPGQGILITTNGGNTINCNYIGTDVSGTLDLGNANEGITIGTSNNVIGGTAAGAGNLISGNNTHGVVIEEASAADNQVLGNLIGTNAAGTAALGNALHGLIIFRAIGTQVSGNLISANGLDGIAVSQAGISNTQIQGNLIGTDATGEVDLGNAGAGISIELSSNVTIGGTSSTTRNLISGNDVHGVHLRSPQSTNNTLQGNYIGTNTTGTLTIPNSQHGVWVQESPNNLIGGTTAGAGNLISGNNVHGVLIEGATATGNQIQSNYVGVDVTGTVALGNAVFGIVVAGGAFNNVIGGTTAAARNVISANRTGLAIGVGTNGTQILGNFIGTNAAGSAALGNLELGIAVDGSQTIIGGTAPGAGNLISGNGGVGIQGGGDNLTIQGNYIGTDLSGTVALPHAREGIFYVGANSLIGGTTAAARNLISGNGGAGVGLAFNATNNQVLGNYIGTNVAGTAALANGAGVVVSEGANGNFIGGTAAGARNVISGNNGAGVTFYIRGNNNSVQGNFIGVNAAGMLALSNSGNGVHAIISSGNTIGGSAAGAANRIAYNGQSGVTITDDPNNPSVNNRILANEIFANGLFGIDLGAFGVNGNDANDDDTGPNNLQNFPVLQTITTPGIVSGSFDSSLTNAAYPVRLDFYANTACDPSGNGEGEVYLGAISLTGPAALFSFSYTPVPGKGFITATATDANGNTSEFSGCRAPNQPPTIFPNNINATVALGTTGFVSPTFLGSISDPDLPNETLTVKVDNAATATVNGVTVALFSQPPPMNVQLAAFITAACNATAATFTLTVTDSVGNTGTATLNVAVSANTPPSTFSYNAPPTIGTGGSATISLASPPTDNGILSYAVQSVTGTATFTGTATVNAAGVVSVSNANPAGTYMVTIRATDNCGAFTEASFPLAVQQRTLTVNGTADVVANDGVCTLREALINANNNNQSGSTDCAAGSGREVIAFNIPGAGPHTITPTSALPTITGPVVIDGTTQPGASCTTAGGLKIELSGASAGSATGLRLTGGNSIVRGLVVNRFAADGIALPTLGSNTLTCNYVGTSVNGTADLGNTVQGISINSSSNTIGGATSGDGNLISGNNSNGLLINNATATGNRVEGNLIGTDITGTQDLGNTGNGIAIGSAANNVIGGTTAGARNIISGNDNNGIQIDRDATAANNRIEGNYIGTDITGTADLGNNSNGVFLFGAANNMVGGTTAAARNIISGNNLQGISITMFSTTPATGNRIEGNYIGTDVTGTLDLGNSFNGVAISASTNNIIGGLTAEVRNIISGNNATGVTISSSSATGNVVQGNYIGTDASGTADLGNTGVGVSLSATVNTTIGGTAAGARNIISGNQSGIQIFGIAASGNHIEGNYIGTDVSGAFDLGNDSDGVRIFSSGPNNVVGGTAVGTRNVISGNNFTGVSISSAGNRVEGNFIGITANGTGALGNDGAGVVLGANNNIVGGVAPASANMIAFNLGSGILVNNGVGNAILGNSIFATRSNPNFPNSGLGIDLYTCVGPCVFGINPNDTGDADTGPNNFQNYPVLNPITTVGTVTGTLDTAAANATYPIRLEFYANTACDSSGNGEGEQFLGSLALADAAAANSFSFTYTPVGGKPYITATATDTAGNTSEFSACQTECQTITLPALPNGTIGQPYNQTVVASPSGYTYSYTLSGALPTGLSFNNGVLSGTPVQTGSFTFTITASTSGGACSGSRTYSNLEFTCPAITVAPAGLAASTAGTAYPSVQLTAPGAFGGSASFSLISGALPAGLTLSSAGMIAGTPLSTGVFNFTVKATDALGCMGTGSYALTINCPAISINPPTLAQAQAGIAYSQSLTQTGGIGAATYAVTAGALPGGLTLSAAGMLAGTTLSTGGFNFSVTTTDSNGCTGVRVYTLNVVCPTITLSDLPPAQSGQAYNQTVSAAPSGGAYTFALNSGSLPTGLSLNASGVLSGTPTQGGTYTFIIKGTGFGGACMGTRTYTFSTNCPTINVRPNGLAHGIVGAVYNDTLSATPANTTYTFAVTTGALPPGLSLNANGTLSGTPTAAGNYSFAATATGFGNCTGTRTYNLLITGTCAPITVNPTSLPGGRLGTAYNQTFSAVPAGTYSYAVTNGALPQGLSLDTNSGVLSGTPTQTGTASFRITVTSAGGCNGFRQYVLAIACATLSFTPPSLAAGRIGVQYNQTIAASPGSGYSYNVLVGQLPLGYSLSSAGILSGLTNQTGTFNFTVRAVAPGGCQGTKAYSLTITANAFAARNDFDGDGRSDLLNWRATNESWQIGQSSDGTTLTLSFGATGDVPVPADYDGDGKADVAVFRPADGSWRILRSSLRQNDQVFVKQWGTATDVPVPGDYDGDGKMDIAVWRGSEGNWYILQSSDGRSRVEAWGTSVAPYNDLPMASDYDGDGQTDLAVFRRGQAPGAGSHWFIKLSRSGETMTKQWGLGSDTPVPADYDGDGLTDIAVWRGQQSNGVWYIWRSTDNTFLTKAWGSELPPTFDVTVPGDYDGDGKSDIAVCRNANTWHILQSSNSNAVTKQLP